MNSIEQYMKTLFGFTFKDDDYNFIEKEFSKKDKEIKRLNNIINELEKWLDETKSGDISFAYSHTLNKLKELKEKNND